ncbi:MAG: hypothetical protein UY96_C0010G0045 [Parcubacteria group bacterium GW2011_GWB1_56_8]|nr:MAG: hypothetical protein UY96_C0010G0045 [Parcubacteria group bacterium GW2011_GWB1_56_8]
MSTYAIDPDAAYCWRCGTRLPDFRQSYDDYDLHCGVFCGDGRKDSYNFNHGYSYDYLVGFGAGMCGSRDGNGTSPFASPPLCFECLRDCRCSKPTS